ncbi:MAG TPA: lactonase family protein [Ktedonobacteraceae bacterium]
MFSQHYQLYLGSYAEATQPGIYAFTFDGASGQLSANWSFAGIVNPSFVALHPNKRWLFAVSETSTHKEGRAGEVWALDLPAQGTEDQARQINHRSSNGDWPCHLSLDASGRWLLVSNYQSGNVSVFPILENGALDEVTDNVQHHGHGPNPERQEGPHTHSTIFTPDQRFVIVADLGLDQLVIYAFDAEHGQLSEHARVRCEPGSGPRHMTFHPNDQHFYVSHELNNTVVVYDYDADQETFSERQTLETVPPGTGKNQTADIHIAPTGDRLYVSNRGNNSIAVYAITEDGLLEKPILSPCGGHWPRHFALAPAGRFLIVANQYGNDITVLPLHAPTQTLDKPCARIALSGASCVDFA